MNLWKVPSLIIQSGAFYVQLSSSPPKIFNRTIYVLEAKRIRKRLQSWGEKKKNLSAAARPIFFPFLPLKMLNSFKSDFVQLSLVFGGIGALCCWPGPLHEGVERIYGDMRFVLSFYCFSSRICGVKSIPLILFSIY